MNYFNESPLNVLPLNSDGAPMERLYGAQRRELERRGDFVKGVLANAGRYGDGRKIDPVLAWHLGLVRGGESKV